MANETDKLELEIRLMMADLEGRQEGIKHMKYGKWHMCITATSLVFEIILLIIIAWSLIR